MVLNNEQARSLYAKLGFLEYGVEKNALKQAGRYYDEVLMAKDASGSRGPFPEDDFLQCRRLPERRPGLDSRCT